MPHADWKIEGYPGHPEIVDTSRPIGTWGRTVAVINQQSGHPLESHPESDALAALFMAAPRLLQACKDVLPYVEYAIEYGYLELDDGSDMAVGLKRLIAEAEQG